MTLIKDYGLYTTKDVAEIYNISPSRLRHIIIDRSIKLNCQIGKLVGKQKLFTKQEIIFLKPMPRGIPFNLDYIINNAINLTKPY